jgi:3-oxoacyl-ACP reductase-like protein
MPHILLKLGSAGIELVKLGLNPEVLMPFAEILKSQVPPVVTTGKRSENQTSITVVWLLRLIGFKLPESAGTG